jgi:hypothetical protein
MNFARFEDLARPMTSAEKHRGFLVTPSIYADLIRTWRDRC